MISFSLLLRKEVALDSRYPVPLLQSLVISPLVTAVPLLLVYRNVFSSSMQIGGWNENNYLTHIGVGLVCHFCLNSGSYVFYNRLLAEWFQHTFALLWFSPLPRLFNIVAVSFSDLLRALVLSSILLTTVAFGKLGWLSVVGAFGAFSLFFFFGVGLGILRFFQQLVLPASPDLVNLFYLGMLFTSGLYFPVRVLPDFLHPVAQLNPILHGKAAILALLNGASVGSSALGFLGPFLLLWSGIAVFTWWASPQITERCLKN